MGQRRPETRQAARLPYNRQADSFAPGSGFSGEALRASVVRPSKIQGLIRKAIPALIWMNGGGRLGDRPHLRLEPRASELCTSSEDWNFLWKGNPLSHMGVNNLFASCSTAINAAFHKK